MGRCSQGGGKKENLRKACVLLRQPGSCRHIGCPRRQPQRIHQRVHSQSYGHGRVNSKSRHVTRNKRGRRCSHIPFLFGRYNPSNSFSYFSASSARKSRKLRLNRVVCSVKSKSRIATLATAILFSSCFLSSNLNMLSLATVYSSQYAPCLFLAIVP